MTLKSCLKHWLVCLVVASMSAWTIGCAKEASTPAPSPPSTSGEPALAPSQAGSETKPGAEVPEPAPEKEKEPAESTEKPTEDKEKAETKPAEPEEKKE